MANNPEDIDFEKVKKDLREVDPEAAIAFEEWARLALEENIEE